jgi:hypothetical protein
MRRILVTAISTAILMLVFAVPAGAGEPFVTVDPASGAPGDPITVSGSCSSPSGFDVEIHFIQGGLDEDLGTTQTGAGGSFSLSATVPAAAQPGAAEIEVQCIVDSSGPLTAGFTVTAPQPPAPDSPAPAAAEPAAAEPVTATPAFTG